MVEVSRAHVDIDDIFVPIVIHLSNQGVSEQ